MKVISCSMLFLVLLALFASNGYAQLCGQGFAEIAVSNSKGEVIADVSIELMTEVSRDYYDKKYRDESAVKISPFNGTAIKISEQEGEEILKQGSQLRIPEDFCGNAFKQYPGSAKLIRPERSAANRGFCTSENFSVPLLLKISVPGYVTDYYVGPFMGGCDKTYKIVLTKKE